MLGTNRLGKDLSFMCISEKCASGAVDVISGTPEGALVFHDCGNEAVLSFDGRSWYLRANENKGVNMGTSPVVIEPRKRGRPRKIQAQVANEEQRERDINLMKGVEVDCPHDVASQEGQDWCAAEFDKRKANIEEQPKPTQAKLTKTEKVEKAEPEFDKEFIKEAKASDTRIDKNLRRGSENFFEAVKELIASGEKEYYKALGFKSFDKYRESKTEYSRSHIGQGIQVYKALHGKITDEKFMALPMPTAVLLTKIDESKLTDALVDEVSGMTIQEFKEKKYPELSSQLVDGVTGKPLPVPQEDFAWVGRIRVHQKVADRWKAFMEVAKWKASGLVDENDIYGDFSVEEKALIVITLECGKSSGWDAEYQEWKQQQSQTPEEAPAF